MNYPCILSETHKLTIESQKNKSSRYDTFSEKNMSSAGTTGKEYVTINKTYSSGKSLETTMSNLIHPKSEKILLLFITIIGCVDIILLCAYLALCIHDQTGQEKTMDTSSPRPNFPGRSTAYENIEFASFSVSEMN